MQFIQKKFVVTKLVTETKVNVIEYLAPNEEALEKFLTTGEYTRGVDFIKSDEHMSISNVGCSNSNILERKVSFEILQPICDNCLLEMEDDEDEE